MRTLRVSLVGTLSLLLTATLPPTVLAQQDEDLVASAAPGEVTVIEDLASTTLRGARAIQESVACALRFARGSEHGSETAPLILGGFCLGGAVASHVSRPRSPRSATTWT